MLRSLVSFSIVLAAGVAGAQPQQPAEPPPKEVIFNPEEVLGETENPGAEPVIVRLRQPSNSLIRVRSDFRPELLQSADLL